MADKHNMSTEACSLFNSSHAYADGYSRIKCTCGWETTGRERDAATLYSTHVMQAIQSENKVSNG